MAELAKVVGIDAGPDGLFWTAAEVMVFESLAGLGVIDGVGFDTVGAGAERITRGSQIVGFRRNDVRVGLERGASVRCGFSQCGYEVWRSHHWR